MIDEAARPELLEVANLALRDGLRGIPEGVNRINLIISQVQKVADSGDPHFQEIVGAVALEFQRDYEKAHKYLGLAAEAGIPSAQRRLGFMFSLSLGIDKDLETAAEFYRRAAEAGDAVAKHNLGCMYLLGDGVPKSPEQAIKLLELAMGEGLSQSANCLADVKRQMKDYAGAREILERIVPEGDATVASLQSLATMHFYGLGGPSDKVKELGCYMKLLDLGDGDAMHYGHTTASEMTIDEIREAAAWARSNAWVEIFAIRD
ncbi:tetratricopeptide repeat protein [Streptomyces sp. NPDC052287]|uniref:tetratricopeptide repeat protein n=1 Tax=Streptomyces sp. NPDC052287 TaxID=3154950 RepID=UPI00341768AF